MTCTNRLDDVGTISLQQALTKIEDWGIDLVALLEDEQHREPCRSRLSSDTTRRVCRPPTSTPYKPRHDLSRKRELVALRGQLEVLQQTLMRQRAQHPKIERTHNQTASEAAALQRECQEMRTRQSNTRCAAQMQNMDLRKAIAESRRDAHKIERLSRRLLSLEKSMPRFTSVTACSITHFGGTFEAPQLQRLRLPGLQQEADMVFTTGAFAAHGSERLKTFREVVLREVGASSVDTIEVLFETAWVLPFPVDDVANALWIQTTRVTTGNNVVQWLDVYDKAASLVSQFVSTPTDDVSKSIKCGQIATHRERSADDRTTQLVSNVQAKAVIGGACVGSYNSDIWARVEPICASESCYPMSQVLWCRRVRIQPPGALCRTPMERSQWKRTILSGPLRAREESMLTCHIQAVENLLVVSSAATT